MNRIAHLFGIRDVSLNSADARATVERAAPAHPHHVADTLVRRRFADDAVVDVRAVALQMLDHLCGAVDCIAFFVARDQHSDRTVRFGTLSAISRSIATTIAASAVFMSAAPRPNSLPSRTIGSNGGEVHCSTRTGRHHVGVTRKRDEWGRVCRAAPRNSSTSPNGSRVIVKPSRSRCAISTS